MEPARTTERGARLRVENLSVGFKAKPVLRGIDLTVPPGELLALAGPNGGGKTTLLKTLGGFLKPLEGRVFLDGQDIRGMEKREKAERISFLFQGMTAGWPFTVRELVSQGRYPYQGLFGKRKEADRRLAGRAIRAAGLEGFEDRRITELSGGEFQRALIARSITQEAALILMDEPANNLDPKYQFIVMDLIRSLAGTGASIILSIHDLNLARLYAHRIALIAGGGVAALGPPEAVLQEELLGAIYDIPPEYRRFFGAFPKATMINTALSKGSTD